MMAANPSYDASPAARQPLVDTFWSAGAWRRQRAWPDAPVMAEVVAAGVMFADPRTLDHDAWVRAGRRAVAAVELEAVGDAFLASLGSRRLDLRSALGSYAVARHLPEHPFAAGPRGCRICGLWAPGAEPEDLNVFSFERFKWGGVRHDHITYAAFDLEQFARAPLIAAGPADIQLGRDLLEYLRGLAPRTTAAQASKGLTMIKSNKYERDNLLEILGLCGILGTRRYPGYADEFIPADRRAEPGQRFLFGRYPVWWWTAADGINAAALRQFLPQLA
jgi:hypothetical protein